MKRRNMAVTLHELGDVKLMQSDYGGALQLYEEALEIQRAATTITRAWR